MEKIDFKKEQVPFTQVANEVLNNPNLSLKAKGLYAYLYSKPEDWDFASLRISNESTDGRDSVRVALAELEAYGLLTRKKLTTGRMEYQIRKKPVTDIPSVGKSVRRKSRPISNKEGGQINREKNKELGGKPPVRFNALGAELIKEFEAIDPKNKTYYGNTTQRGACDFLITEYGFETAKTAIIMLQQTNTLPYFPTITTPVQLRDKWVQLHNAINKEGTKIQVKKREEAKPRMI